MPRYVAFLRAVNVGGRIVRMEYLRELLTALKLSNVETFIASGNASFEAPEHDAATLERRIERGLAAALRYEVGTYIRTTSELAAVAAHAPFDEPGASLHVGFLKDEPTAEAIERVMRLTTATDAFHLRGREFWWRTMTKLSESKVTGAALERALGTPTTMRNINTVRRLAAKYRPESTSLSPSARPTSSA